VIRAGDVYQLNFTAPMRFEVPGGAASLYARCAHGSRSTTERSCTGSRIAAFFRFRRSCSFASKMTEPDAAGAESSLADERHRASGAHYARGQRHRQVLMATPKTAART